MISLAKYVLISILILELTCYQLDESNFLIFNTSSRKMGLSISIASNISTQFQSYSPLLINSKQSSVKFLATPHEKRFTINPQFVQPQSLLFNDQNQGEYWYGFKKQVDPKRNPLAAFGLNRITYNGKAYNFLMPFFGMPLTFLNFDNLYKCDNVLISYLKTDVQIDLTIFSSKQSWHVFPQATWGFRNKDNNVHYSRQTYPLGTNIQLDVGTDHFCYLNTNLPKNQYTFVEKEIYTVEDLLNNLSHQLQLKQKTKQTQAEL